MVKGLLKSLFKDKAKAETADVADGSVLSYEDAKEMARHENLDV